MRRLRFVLFPFLSMVALAGLRPYFLSKTAHIAPLATGCRCVLNGRPRGCTPRTGPDLSCVFRPRRASSNGRTPKSARGWPALTPVFNSNSGTAADEHADWSERGKTGGFKNDALPRVRGVRARVFRSFSARVTIVDSAGTPALPVPAIEAGIGRDDLDNKRRTNGPCDRHEHGSRAKRSIGRYASLDLFR
jgi:hypothetical protein